MRKYFFLAALLVVLVPACRKDHASGPSIEEPVVLTPYAIEPPMHFPRMIIPEDNRPYVEKIKVGRMLYYDAILSNDGRACAGCHNQDKGFTRDAMLNGVPVLPHVNLAWTTNFMWNGAVQGTLEDAMLFEVKDFFHTDLAKVNADARYRELFRKYFGVKEIGYKDLAYALAQFVRTIISRDTRYDRWVRGAGDLSYDEAKGRNIFFSEKGDCFHCHVNPVLSDGLFHNTGLDSPYTTTESRGLYNVTGLPSDIGKFRTANLRNVSLRKRYMHNGRFSTLEEVIEFYNSGVRRVDNLDPVMTKPGKENGLRLTDEEKYQLRKFLETFTDTTFLSDTTLAPV